MNMLQTVHLNSFPQIEWFQSKKYVNKLILLLLLVPLKPCRNIAINHSVMLYVRNISTVSCCFTNLRIHHHLSLLSANEWLFRSSLQEYCAQWEYLVNPCCVLYCKNFYFKAERCRLVLLGEGLGLWVFLMHPFCSMYD